MTLGVLEAIGRTEQGGHWCDRTHHERELISLSLVKVQQVYVHLHLFKGAEKTRQKATKVERRVQAQAVCTRHAYVSHDDELVNNALTT